MKYNLVVTKVVRSNDIEKRALIHIRRKILSSSTGRSEKIIILQSHCLIKWVTNSTENRAVVDRVWPMT